MYTVALFAILLVASAESSGVGTCCSSLCSFDALPVQVERQGTFAVILNAYV